MKTKGIIFFILAVAVSTAGATYRWADSGHSIGLIKASGGQARHPSYLESGKDRYMLIATATVIPPYKGDVRVVLEGRPVMDYEIYASAPVADLGIRRWPKFENNILYGLKPKDRVALWVLMRPPVLDPVCGMAKGEGFLKHSGNGRDYYFCSEACLSAFKKEPGRYEGGDRVTGKYALALYDTLSGKSVLNVPVIFKGGGETKDAGGHQH
ncbi:MAG: YHS domain-containing protein [Thermodesulfovibrionales bacterium]|nr:YHS domain-containing protein [Thermodesulfovibrionales bacterium]